VQRDDPERREVVLRVRERGVSERALDWDEAVAVAATGHERLHIVRNEVAASGRAVREHTSVITSRMPACGA